MKLKKNNRQWVVAAVFFLLVCAGLIWITRQSPIKTLQEENPSIKVYYEKNTPTPEKSAATRILQSTPTPLPQMSDDIQQTTGSSQIQHYLFCTVKDVLGEPVDHGVVQFATQSIAFKNGYARIENESLPSQPFVLAASAEGYQPAEKTINLQNTSEVEFVLDYYCDFSILVYNKGVSQAPVPGASVSLYRSKDCLRPLAHTQSALVEFEAKDYPPLFVFQYEDGEIKIFRSNASKSLETFNFVSDETPFMFRYPKFGDKLLTIGTRDPSLENYLIDPCEFHGKYHAKRFDYVLPPLRSNSRNARLMDVLHVSAKQRTASMNHAEIRFSRDDRWYSAKCLYLPACGEDAQLITQTVSNERGECRFEKLSPGLYYAQAALEGRRSMVRPLFPTSGGAKLTLDDSCRLHIHTLRKGVIPDNYYLHGEKVPNTSVMLRRKDETTSGVYSVKTNFYGGAVIDSIPYGTYTVTAQPEEKSNLSPVKTETVLNQPDQTLDIGFTDWSHHSIEGTVVEYDTLAPIPNIYLELNEYRWGGFDPCAGVTTDANGAFAFHDLPEGKYKLTYHPSAREEHLYYLYEDNTNLLPDYAPFYNGRELSKLIVLRDKPVYTIQLKMIGTVATHFSGQVVDNSGRPISGANVQLLRHAELDSLKPIQLPHGKVYSDKNGEFEITIWTRNLPEYNEQDNQGRLFASTVTANSLTTDETARSIDKVAQSVIPEESGYQDVPFHFGDSIDDLRIVIDDNDYFAVEGRLRTEDGRAPNGANVYVIYYTRELESLCEEILGKYDSVTGNFSIRGARNEPFGIRVAGAYIKNEDETLTEYLDVYFGISKEQAQELYQNAKSNQEKIKIEITLTEAGFLSGQVFDANHNPMPNVFIQTDASIHKSMTARTDEDGKFRISPLDKKKTYSLYRGSLDEASATLLMSDLHPPVENIILIWKEGEPE